MNEVEIFFRDLTEGKQQEMLEAAGISDCKEMNWDVFPLTTIVVGDEDETMDENNSHHLGEDDIEDLMGYLTAEEDDTLREYRNRRNNAELRRLLKAEVQNYLEAEEISLDGIDFSCFSLDQRKDDIYRIATEVMRLFLNGET